MVITGRELKWIKDCLKIEELEKKLLIIEEKVNKPRLEDIWYVQFEEIESGFAPKSAYKTDAGHDLKVCPSNINVRAINRVKQYLELSETDEIHKLPDLYVDGKYQDWFNMFVEDRIVILNELFAKVNKEPVVCLEPKDYKNSELISCGFKVALPDLSVIPGWTSVMIATPRSGLGINCKIQLSNTIGVIDQSYRGEVKVALSNNSDNLHIFSKGARVAQALIMPCMNLSQENTLIVNTLEETQRADKGFGSSGV